MNTLSPAVPVAPARLNVPAEIFGTRAALFYLWGPAPQLPQISGQAQANFQRVTKVTLEFPGTGLAYAAHSKPQTLETLFLEDNFWFKRNQNSLSY